MPNRIIREGFLDSDSVNGLSAFSECVYLRMLLASDDAGRLDGRPSILGSKIYPHNNRKPADILKALEQIHKAGLARKYEVGGKEIIQMARWQRCGKSKHSRFPNNVGDYDISYTPVQTRDGNKDFIAESVWNDGGVAMGSVRGNEENQYGDGDGDGDGDVGVQSPKRGDLSAWWNGIASAAGLSSVSCVTDSRWAKFKTRTAEGLWDSRHDISREIQASEFLKTGGQNRVWTVTLDWLLVNGSNWIKVVEGQYRQKKVEQPTI